MGKKSKLRGALAKAMAETINIKAEPKDKPNDKAKPSAKEEPLDHEYKVKLKPLTISARDGSEAISKYLELFGKNQLQISAKRLCE
ncbi:MAG: hypothetical protein AB1489_41980, partial [Acidobacteriota bacterium]